MATEIVEYSNTEAALAELATRYKDVVFDVTTREGMAAAAKGRAEIRKYRTSLEDLRKAIKAPALRRCQVIDDEARRITAQLVALESPIDEQIRKEEQRKTDERNAAVKAEQDRLAAEERARKEADEAKLATERKALEEARTILEAEKRRQEREVRDAREKLEAEQRAVRLQIEQEERRARAAREEADRIARAARQAEEDNIRAERDKLDAERRAAEDASRKLREEQEAKERAARAEVEAKERAEREALEAVEREERRKAADIIEAGAMLTTFLDRHGKKPEFAGVVKAITAYFKKTAKEQTA